MVHHCPNDFFHLHKTGLQLISTAPCRGGADWTLQNQLPVRINTPDFTAFKPGIIIALTTH